MEKSPRAWKGSGNNRRHVEYFEKTKNSRLGGNISDGGFADKIKFIRKMDKRI